MSATSWIKASIFSIVLIVIGGAAIYWIVGMVRIPDESNIPGTYQLIADWGTSTLVLLQDNTSNQIVRTKNGETRSVQGRWKLDHSRGNHLLLQTFLECNHYLEPGTLVEYADVGIETSGFAGMHIDIDPDWAIEFKK